MHAFCSVTMYVNDITSQCLTKVLLESHFSLLNKMFYLFLGHMFAAAYISGSQQQFRGICYSKK